MKWSDEHAEYAIQNWQVMTDAEIGDHVGRTAQAVASWRRSNNLHRTPAPARDIDALIIRHWPRRSAADIGCALGYGATYIRLAAARLGLPPKPQANCCSNAPGKPKGLTRSQILWAEVNILDPEARMILAMSGRDMRT
jgi:hypothetical protein